MIPIVPPGPSPARYNGVYTKAQDEKWQIWSDWIHAQSYGFGQTRMATPGNVLSEQQVLERQAQILVRMKKEQPRIPFSRVPEPQEVPWHLWEYICEALIPYPSTEARGAGMPRATRTN